MRQVTRKSLMTVAAATGVIAAAGGYAHADSAANGVAMESPGVLSGNSVQAPINIPVNVCGNTVDVVGALNPSFGNSCANKSGGASSGGGYGDHRGGGGSQAGNHGGNHQGGNHNGGSHNGGGRDGSDAQSGSGGAHAGGYTGGSAGVGSGNHVQAPIDVPVNVCGNSVDVVGLLNPSMGNDCANGGGADVHTPPSRGHETPGKPGDQGPGKPGEHGQSNPSGPGAVPSTSDHVTPAGAASAHRPAAQPAAAQLAHTGSDLPMGLVLPAGAGALLAGAVLYRKARATV